MQCCLLGYWLGSRFSTVSTDLLTTGGNGLILFSLFKTIQAYILHLISLVQISKCWSKSISLSSLFLLWSPLPWPTIFHCWFLVLRTTNTEVGSSTVSGSSRHQAGSPGSVLPHRTVGGWSLITSSIGITCWSTVALRQQNHPSSDCSGLPAMFPLGSIIERAGDWEGGGRRVPVVYFLITQLQRAPKLSCHT